jgi:3-hydroxyisobutyrate dehydrogenase-like beta-hydroxyacid dehydrogenase
VTTIFMLGVGHMGSGMAANLVRAGFDVLAFDISDDNLARAVASGCTAAESTAAGAAVADVVMTSLPGPVQISSAGRMDDGLLPNMAPGAIWIDLSTNDLHTARLIADDAAEAGVVVIDAPVSGGPEGAAAGTLSVYVGGPDDAVAACRPIFEAIGSNVDHLGPHGAGYVAKIAQVTLCYTQTITFVEALMLGVKGGVAPAKMTELIQKSAGRSYVADVYGPEIVAGTYDESFSIALAAKDMRLATEMAATMDVDLPFMARVAERYAAAEAHYGSAAPHLLAAQLTETANDLLFHEQPDQEIG